MSRRLKLRTSDSKSKSQFPWATSPDMYWWLHTEVKWGLRWNSPLCLGRLLGAWNDIKVIHDKRCLNCLTAKERWLYVSFHTVFSLAYVRPLWKERRLLCPTVLCGSNIHKQYTIDKLLKIIIIYFIYWCSSWLCFSKTL